MYLTTGVCNTVIKFISDQVISSYAMTPFMLSQPTEHMNIHTCKTVHELINNLVVPQY